MTQPEPLRVLFLATEWGSNHGGVSTLNRQLASAVACVQGVEVWCAVPRKPSQGEREMAEGAGVHLLHAADCPGEEDNDSFLLITPMKLAGATTEQARASHDAIAGLRFDAVVGHGRWTGPAAGQIAQRHSIPVLVHIVHVDPSRIEQHKPSNEKGRATSSGRRADSRTYIELRLAKNASLVFGVGPRLTAPLRNAYGLDARELIPGFSASELNTSGIGRSALLVARLDDRDIKGLDLALDALHEVATSGKVELELRGAIDEEETKAAVEAHLEKLRAVNDHRGLLWQVTPFTSQAEYLELSFGRAQVVLMPSRDEGFGLVALEAISRGRPVVVCDTSGFAELVKRVTEPAHQEVRQSFVFDSAHPRRLAPLVTEIFADIERAQHRARTLRSLLATECDWIRTANKFVAAIREQRAKSGPSSSDPSDGHLQQAPAQEPRLENLGRSGLEAWPRRIGSTWVERPEERRLREALERDDTGPVLLVGPPGCGKSALLSKLAIDLRSEGWTVVAIKADQIPTNVRNEADLCGWLGIGGVKLSAFLGELALTERSVVLILDQLDALASLVDLHTARLSILLAIVRSCADVPAVRVVASMRGLESRYDLQLRELREASGHDAPPVEIRLSQFSSDAVGDTWEREVGERLVSIPEHLREPRILKLAVHLRQACASAPEVAEKFWDRCVADAPQESTTALFGLISRMDESEAFWLDAAMPGDSTHLEHWLVSAPMLARIEEHPPRYGFVHQTLHEEARARRWLEAKSGEEAESLIAWVQARLDTLTYRPKLRAILQRLRIARPQLHAEVFERLWGIASGRASLRELLAVHLAQAEVPSAWDIQRMQELLRGPDPWLRYSALAVLRGREPWFRGLSSWLETRVKTEDARWLVHYIAGAWTFAQTTLDRWLSGWTMVPDRRRLVLIAFAERAEWTEDGFRQFLLLANHEADNHLVATILGSSFENDARRRAIGAAHYASSYWGRVGHEGDPYQVPESYYWQEIASGDPVTFVEELAPALVRAAQRATRVGSATKKRFAVDNYAHRYIEDSYRHHPLEAFAYALRVATQRTQGRCSALAQLGSVDNDSIQDMLLEAYGSVAEAAPELVAGFLLGDARRLLLGKSLPSVLRKLAPHLKDPSKGELLALLPRVSRYSIVDEDRSERDDLEYQRLLRDLIVGEELEVAQQEMVDFIERPIRGGLVRSPYSAEELAHMDDAGFETTLTYYAGRDDVDFSGDEPVGGNRQLCQELELMAEREPLVAQTRLEHLLSHFPKNAHLRDAVVSLLAGLTKSVEDLAILAGLLERALDGGVFVGSDNDDRDARWSAAYMVRAMISKGWTPGINIIDALRVWAREDATQEEPVAEAIADEKSLLPNLGGGGVVPRGSYPFINSLFMAVANERPNNWANLLNMLEELLNAVDARSWRFLLSHTYGLRPGKEYEARWLAWLDRLFETHPRILADLGGACAVWNQRWVADPVRMQAWLERIARSKWPSGRRAANELSTLLIAIDPHSEWARARLEARLSSPADDHVMLSVAHGLGTLWSDESAHALAEPWMDRLVATASPAVLAKALPALRRGALRPSETLFHILRTVERRKIKWPRELSYGLAGSLLEAVHQYPEEAAVAASRLVDDLDEQGGATGVEEHLTLLALHLTRSDNDVLRKKGMDLFERVLVSEGWYVRRAMKEIDDIPVR